MRFFGRLNPYMIVFIIIFLIFGPFNKFVGSKLSRNKFFWISTTVEYLGYVGMLNLTVFLNLGFWCFGPSYRNGPHWGPKGPKFNFFLFHQKWSLAWMLCTCLPRTVRGSTSAEVSRVIYNTYIMFQCNFISIRFWQIKCALHNLTCISSFNDFG